MHLKTVNLYILICLIFCSCNSKNKDKKYNIKAIETESSKNIEDTNLLDYYLKGDSIMCKANKGLPQLSYKFNLDSTGYFLKTIHVYSNFIKIQEITANKHIERKEFDSIYFNLKMDLDITNELEETLFEEREKLLNEQLLEKIIIGLCYEINPDFRNYLRNLEI